MAFAIASPPPNSCQAVSEANRAMTRWGTHAGYFRPRSTRWRRNADQPDLSSLAPSQIPRISRNPSELTAEATSSETLRPCAAHPPVPPSLDLGVDLLVQARHRARADTGAPQRLGDVLDPAD